MELFSQSSYTGLPDLFPIQCDQKLEPKVDQFFPKVVPKVPTTVSYFQVAL